MLSCCQCPEMGHYRVIDTIIKVTEHAAESAEVRGCLATKVQEGFALLVQMIEGFLHINWENMLLMHIHQ